MSKNDKSTADQISEAVEIALKSQANEKDTPEQAAAKRLIKQKEEQSKWAVKHLDEVKGKDKVTVISTCTRSVTLGFFQSKAPGSPAVEDKSKRIIIHGGANVSSDGKTGYFVTPNSVATRLTMEQFERALTHARFKDLLDSPYAYVDASVTTQKQADAGAAAHLSTQDGAAPLTDANKNPNASVETTQAQDNAATTERI